MLSFARYSQPHARERSAIVSKLFNIHGSGCYYCTTSTGSTNNIMCLDGGKLHIERANTEAYDFFIQCYAEDILNGIPHYIVEKNATAVFSSDNKTRGFDDPDPIVNFFCELDIQRLGSDNLFGNTYPARPLTTCFVTADEWNAAGPTPLDCLKHDVRARRDFVSAVVGIMFGVIARSYCDQNVALTEEVRGVLECVVADSYGEAKGDAWQAGLHLHFPKIQLRLSSIAILTHAMTHALQQHMPVGNRENSWSDRLDRSPYRCGSGLRLVGSYKAKVCPGCASSKASAKKSASNSVHASAMRPPVVCETCFGVQFVHINRRYMPWLKLRYSGICDPRTITSSRADAVMRCEVVDEFPMQHMTNSSVCGVAPGVTLKVMTDWVRQCSTKIGIAYGSADVFPRGFVGDSTYALIPAQVTAMRPTVKGKTIKVARPTATTSDTEYVVAPEPMIKPPSGLKAMSITPDSSTESAVAELVSMIPLLFQVSHWDSLEVRSFKYFTPRATLQSTRSQVIGESNIYIIVHLKASQGVRFCTNKNGHHSKNVIYFEVHTAKTVEENLLSSMSCLSSSQDKLRTSKRIAYIVQRCFSAKKNSDGTCRTYAKSVEYPLHLEGRIFPQHVKAMVSTSGETQEGSANTMIANSTGQHALHSTSSSTIVKRLLPEPAVYIQSSSNTQCDAYNCNASSQSSQTMLSSQETVSRKRVNRGTLTPGTMATIALLARSAKPLKE